MIAQKSGAAEQRRAGRERAQMRGFFGTDLRRGARAAIKIEQAVSLDARNLGELALEPIGGAQRRQPQGIRRLEHEQRLLALGKQPIEFGRGARHGIAGHDQTLDRRIVGDLQGAVDAGRRQEQEYGRQSSPASAVCG